MSKSVSAFDIWGSRSSLGTPMDVLLHLNPSFTSAPVNEYLSDLVVKAVSKPNQRIILTIGSQIGKSTMITETGITWALYHKPSLRVMLGSYNSDFAGDFGRKIKSNLEALGVEISKESSSKADFALAKGGGGFFATGIGGGTGRPADLLVLDDPVKGLAEANSPTERGKVNEWFSGSLRPRLGNGASVIVVMTRWHNDDLAGHLIKTMGRKGELMDDGSEGIWEVHNIPAQAGENDVLGREPGEWLETTRGWDAQEWESRRRDMGLRAFEAIYQGNPTPASGKVFDIDSLGDPVPFSSVKNLLEERGVWMSSWDLAASKSRGSDYTVGQVWCKVDSTMYLVDQVRGQWSLTETISRFEHIEAKYPRLGSHLVESKSNGLPFIEAIRDAGVSGVKPFNPGQYGDKYARAEMAAPLIDAGDLVLVEGSWNSDILREMSEFPSGRNDDTVDALSQAKIMFDMARKRRPIVIRGI